MDTTDAVDMVGDRCVLRRLVLRQRDVDTIDARNMVGARDALRKLALRAREMDTIDVLNMVVARDVLMRLVLRQREMDTTDARNTVEAYAAPIALIGQTVELVIQNTTVGARHVSNTNSPTIHEAKSHPQAGNCWCGRE